jgi:hypothetical protein
MTRMGLPEGDIVGNSSGADDAETGLPAGILP